MRRASLELNIGTETPIFSNMTDMEIILFMLNNVFVTMIFFVAILSFILIVSLVQTDVEERKYEFAVLRTLGMKNRDLIALISIQTLVFAVPAIVLGFAAMKVMVMASTLVF